MEKEEFSTSRELRKAVTSSGLKDLTYDGIETVFDSNLEDGVLKEIPGIKLIVTLYKSVRSISDAIFVKKAFHVLFELKDVDENKRKKFIEALDDDISTGSEKIMFAVNHLETVEKSIVFGRLCKIRAEGKITKHEFLELSKLIQDAYLPDLKEFKTYKTHKTWSDRSDSKFLRLGLIVYLIDFFEDELQVEKNEKGEYKATIPEDMFEHVLSDLGELLKNVINDLFPR